MIIAVFSDTHGNTARMARAAEALRPDALVHLGDYERDAAALRRALPDTPLYQVCGNCDVAPTSPDRLIADFGAVRALLVHGHQYGVDRGRLDSLIYAAQEAQCRLVLFGHTHERENLEIGGVRAVNPGSAGMGRAPSFAVVEIFDNGGVAASIRDL